MNFNAIVNGKIVAQGHKQTFGLPTRRPCHLVESFGFFEPSAFPHTVRKPICLGRVRASRSKKRIIRIFGIGNNNICCFVVCMFFVVRRLCRDYVGVVEVAVVGLYVVFEFAEIIVAEFAFRLLKTKVVQIQFFLSFFV